MSPFSSVEHSLVLLSNMIAILVRCKFSKLLGLNQGWIYIVNELWRREFEYEQFWEQNTYY
jgi:hypothetical protein